MHSTSKGIASGLTKQTGMSAFSLQQIQRQRTYKKSHYVSSRQHALLGRQAWEDGCASMLLVCPKITVEPRGSSLNKGLWKGVDPV